MDVPLDTLSLKALVRSLLSNTRPISDEELLAGLNFGYGKALRAARAVRPQAFLSYVDPFTLSAGVAEYDLDAYSPAIWRPVRMLVGAGSSTGRKITFRYKALTHPEFEADEVSVAAARDTLYYDILTGRLPGTETTATSGSGNTLSVASADDMALGKLIQVPGAGSVQMVGSASIPGDYLGIVVGISGLDLTVQPALTADVVAGTAVVPYRRRVLRFVPPLSESVTGRLYYNYQPKKLVADSDLVDPLVEEHRDILIAYALAWVKRAVGDNDAEKWAQDGLELRSEMIQEIDPLAMGTEFLGSDLGVEDY